MTQPAQHPTPPGGTPVAPPRAASLTLLELQAIDTLQNSAVLDMPQRDINAVLIYHLRELRKQGKRQVDWQRVLAGVFALATLFGPTVAELLRQNPTAFGGAAGTFGLLLTAWFAAKRKAGAAPPPDGPPGAHS